jgi:hypothetical protein
MLLSLHIVFPTNFGIITYYQRIFMRMYVRFSDVVMDCYSPVQNTPDNSMQTPIPNPVSAKEMKCG